MSISYIYTIWLTFIVLTYLQTFVSIIIIYLVLQEMDDDQAGVSYDKEQLNLQA